MRTVASQMNDATGTSAQLRLVADVPSGLAAGQEAEFSASGRVITFSGFLRAYQEGRDEDDPDTDSAEEMVLPALAEGDRVEGTAFEPGSHTTQPPARYTEASLVKAMEELGVGRPSTYASVIATILDRGYVWKKGTALVPSFTAFAVVGLLERYFGNLVDYGFTASMEDDLDEIASGTEEALPWLTRFYFGSDAPGAMASDGTEVDTLGLKATVSTHLAEIDAREVNSIPLGDGSDGQPIVAARRPLRPLPPTRRGPGLHPRRPGARRAHHRPRRGDPRGALQRPRPRHPSRERARDPGQGRPLRSLRAGRRGRRRRSRSRARRHCSPPWTRRRLRSSRRSTCSASRGRSAPTRRQARRSSRTTAASVRTSSEGPTRGASRARTSS